jgi:hypothetical protein
MGRKCRKHQRDRNPLKMSVRNPNGGDLFEDLAIDDAD